MCKKRFHSYFVRWWILEWICCCCWSRKNPRSCKTAGPALGVERKSQQQQQQVCEKAQLTFIVAMYSMNEDAEYCLSLLKRIPDPNMRSGTRGWSLPRSQTTHVRSDCESSTGSSSSAAAHPSPLMSTRGRRELSLHLRQQRLQLLSSSDGGFNYITAAKAAKAANHMVCKTVSSTWNSESVVVLYRGGPRV
jgi:hypothetical protein